MSDRSHACTPPSRPGGCPWGPRAGFRCLWGPQPCVGMEQGGMRGGGVSGRGRANSTRCARERGWDTPPPRERGRAPKPGSVAGGRTGIGAGTAWQGLVLPQHPPGGVALGAVTRVPPVGCGLAGARSWLGSSVGLVGAWESINVPLVPLLRDPAGGGGVVAQGTGTPLPPEHCPMALWGPSRRVWGAGPWGPVQPEAARASLGPAGDPGPHPAPRHASSPGPCRARAVTGTVPAASAVEGKKDVARLF